VLDHVERGILPALLLGQSNPVSPFCYKQVLLIGADLRSSLWATFSPADTAQPTKRGFRHAALDR